ncbi:MAG: RHS repeat-associated core domain-containing protein [Patescibacteria group bacterium]
MKSSNKFIAGLLISLFILPLQLILTDFSFAKEPAPAKETPASQVILPPKEGKVELTEKRTATSKTYLKSDGGKEMTVYQSPIHYQDSKKQWQEINVNLQDSKIQIIPTAPKEYENTANNFRISLSDNLAQKAFSLQKNDAQVDLKLSDIKSADGTNFGFTKESLDNVKPERYQNRLTYKNVYKDTDITYYSMTSGLKEDIVLNSYSGQNQFTFDLNVSNASYEKQKDGSYIFYKPGTKEIQLRMPKFYMWDNFGGKDSESNRYSYDVGTEIVDNNGSLTVVLTADNNWLSSKDRVFPITIDPSFVTNDIEDTYVQTGYPDVKAWDQRALWVGQGSTKGIMRSLVLFNIPVPDLYGARISSSRFEVLQYGNCTGVCTSAGVSAFTTTNFNPWESTWNNRPVELEKVGNAANTSTWDWFVMDITSAAQHWIYNNYDGSVPGGLEFIQDGEINWGYRTWAAQNNPDYTWGQPRLVIEYNDYNIEYSSTDMPNAIAGTTSEIPVTLSNKGRNTWTKDQFKLSYHLINNSTGEQVIYDGLRTNLPKDVVKGDSVSVLAKFKAPPVIGNYTIQWDMIQEGVTWFSGQGLPTADRTISVSPPSFSSMSHLGTESYYAKAGPVDLASGNLSYSSIDLSVASATGGLAVGRSYNSNTLDQTFSADSQGYIRTWLLNGPYKENDAGVRLTRSYIPNQDTVRPSLGSTSSGNLWFKNDSNSNITNLNSAFDSVGAVQNGRAANMAAYANVYVYTPTTKSLKLKTGSDDGIRIWLNGSMVRSNDIIRGITLDSDVDDVRLFEGWNTLLVKVTQSANEWNMSARFTNPDGTPVTDLKYSFNYPEVFGGSKISAKGWTFNFDQKLFINDLYNIYYRDGTGTINIFTKNSDGSYNTPPGSDIKLAANADHSFTFTNKSGLKTNFSEDGKIANSLNLSGNKIEYQYDSSYPKKCIKIVDGSRYITIAYTGDKVSSVADQLGNIYSYTYDLLVPSNLIKVTDPNNVSFSYGYGPDGKMVKFNDKMSSTTQINYSNGKVSQLIDPLGNITTFNYLDKSTEITDALSRKSSAGFNEVNLLTSFTNTKNYKELYTYDGKYNITSVTPAIPENDFYYYKWSYTYDGQGNLLSEKDPTDAVTSYQYSGNDLIKVTDPQGKYSQYTYSTDGRRLLLSSTDPKGNKNSFIYDSKGRVISATDPKLAIIKYSYNADGNLLTFTSPKNEITTFSYNSIGQKITGTSPMGLATKYFYDKLSRLYRVVDPAGLTITYTYDSNSNKIRETYPNTTAKYFYYDKLNRLIRVTDEVGAAISYQYDTVGNKIKDIDANSKATTYQYDELNQLISQTDPSGAKWTIQYDRNGQPIKTIDAKGQSDGQEYNKAGQLTKNSDPDGTTTLSYNSSGNVTGAATTVNSENLSVAYDSNDNVTNVASNVTGAITNTYDKNDNPATIATSAATIGFGYDANNQVTQVSSTLKTGLQITNKLVKDADGKLTSIQKANGDVTGLTYDASSRIASITNKNKLGTVQQSFAYVYDLASNITSITDKYGVKQYYSYDARNQLIKENAITYTYDPMGNRKTRVDGFNYSAYTYDTAGDANRLLSYTDKSGATSFNYDANGSVTKKTTPAGITQYFYDSDSYFTKAVLPNGTTVEYTYDKLAKHRIQRKETSSVGTVSITKFVYDGDRLVAETNTAGNILKSYTWDENESLISITLPISGVLKTFYYLKNAKGDVLGLADEAGNRVVDYTYDAWGNITRNATISATVPTNLNALNPRLYAGYWYDSTLGLYFMKTRMYDSRIGRFLSKDRSIGGAGSALDFNPYIYSKNNPIDRIDPDGKLSWSAVTQFASRVVQAVKKAVQWFGEGLNYAIEVATSSKNKTISRLAKKTLAVVDWTSGSVLKTAAVAAVTGIYVGSALVGGAIAIGSALVGGAAAVQAAIAYVTGLGGYGAATGTAVYMANMYAQSVYQTALRNTPNQTALIELAKIEQMKGGTDIQTAQTLVGWAQEYGLPYAEHLAGHIGRGTLPHIEIGPVNHIFVNISNLVH